MDKLNFSLYFPGPGILEVCSGLIKILAFDLLGKLYPRCLSLFLENYELAS